MEQYDLSMLSPDEIQQLTIHAIKSSEAMAEQISKLEEVIKMLSEKTSSIEDVVMNEIIGGVENLYNKNLHDSTIESIKQKYGHLFDPHMDALREFYPDADIYEELYKEKENFEDDGAYDSRVNELAGLLKGKMEKIRGVKEPVVSVEETKVETPVEVPEVEKEDNIVDVIKKMKGKKNPMSMS
jgi:hypothetical protein